jgi:hypothetical protein
MRPYAVISVTEADKNLIVQLHNNLRRNVAYGKETRGNPGPQPPAANMRKLVRNIEEEENSPGELHQIMVFCRAGMTN